MFGSYVFEMTSMLLLLRIIDRNGLKRGLLVVTTLNVLVARNKIVQLLLMLVVDLTTLEQGIIV